MFVRFAAAQNQVAAFAAAVFFAAVMISAAAPVVPVV